MQTLIDHYTHKPKNYETITYQDIKAGKLQGHVDFISLRGDVCHAKVTSTKLWKTKVEIQIGLKYGLYEYATTLSYPDNTYCGVELVKELLE